MSSQALRQVARDYLRTVGKSTLKAVTLTGLTGVATFFVTHQGFEASLEVGVLVAALTAVATLIVLLALAVGRQDRRLAQLARDFEIVNQKIAAHKAIAAWVNNCETSLNDTAEQLSPDALALQALKSLKQNTLNSLGYSFYGPDLSARIRSLAAGEPGQSVDSRLDDLLSFLKKDLEAGSFLV
jgi:hypothetical protein